MAWHRFPFVRRVGGKLRQKQREVFDFLCGEELRFLA